MLSPADAELPRVIAGLREARVRLYLDLAQALDDAAAANVARERAERSILSLSTAIDHLSALVKSVER